MAQMSEPPEWDSPSPDPNDEQFGDVVEPVTIDEADAYDVVLVGEPYDEAVLGRPGARGGPAALRRSLAGAKSAHLTEGSVTSIGDLGNIDVPAGQTVTAAQDSIREVTERIHALDAFPVFLGGDHSLVFPNVAPLIGRYDSVGVVNLDAHADVRRVDGQPNNGTPFRQLFEAGLQSYVLVGARHFETSQPYLMYLREHGATVISAPEAGTAPIETADAAVEALGDVEAVYLSCDIDVLDMSGSLGSTAPTPGGLSSRELYQILYELSQMSRLVGFELVGCAPSLDSERKSVKAGSRAIAHVISGRQ